MGAGIARVAYRREIEVDPEQHQRKQHNNDENGSECRKVRVLHEPALSGVVAREGGRGAPCRASAACRSCGGCNLASPGLGHRQVVDSINLVKVVDKITGCIHDCKRGLDIKSGFKAEPGEMPRSWNLRGASIGRPEALHFALASC
jgi:hypothetical protein